jgi:hypothetical protein
MLGKEELEEQLLLSQILCPPTYKYNTLLSTGFCSPRFITFALSLDEFSIPGRTKSGMLEEKGHHFPIVDSFLYEIHSATIRTRHGHQKSRRDSLPNILFTYI